MSAPAGMEEEEEEDESHRHQRKAVESCDRLHDAAPIALWDLMGKVVGKPTHKILGEFTNRIRVYTAGGYYQEDKGEVMAERIRVGTSGWHYAHWRGPFYPERMSSDKMLDFYCQRLATVEVNNSFYHLPAKETFRLT